MSSVNYGKGELNLDTKIDDTLVIMSLIKTSSDYTLTTCERMTSTSSLRIWAMILELTPRM